MSDGESSGVVAIQQQEPQLKYLPLTGDVPNILEREKVTCLCLSDKILAIGTDVGAIHMLDYQGNQIKRLQHHRTHINDLSFDAAGEFVASCSADRSVCISSLYSDSTVRHDYGQPVQAVALDPSYSIRKSNQVATVLLGPAGTTVQLSTQGWLGRSDLVLGKDAGTQLVRWWGTLVAWINGDTLKVHCTSRQRLIRTITRPPRGPAAPYSQASLLWGQNGFLYASWPDCIKVCRAYTVENNIGGSAAQVELLTSWVPQHLVLGLAPFGRDLAVLTYTAAWTTPQTATLPGAPRPASPAAADPPLPLPPQQKQPAGLQLRIMSPVGAELACDDLQGGGPLLDLLPGGAEKPYWLIPSLPATSSAVTASQRLRRHGPGASSSSDAKGAGGSSPSLVLPASGALLVGALDAPGAVLVPPPSFPPPGEATPGAGATSAAAGGGAVGGGSSGAAAATPHSVLSPPVGVSPKAGSVSHVDVPGLVAAALEEGYPAYEPDAEFMYFVMTPSAVLVGRTRDLSDHSQWLMSQGMWAQALELQEQRPREITPEVQEQVVQGYIGHLLSSQAWDEAAMLSPRLLREDAEKWQRMVYIFAQARQLPKLAKVLPMDSPRLPTQMYELVLKSLLANPSDHATALELARKWPPGRYSAPALVEAVVERMKRGGPGGETRELWLLLSHLYEGQGRPDLALAILLQQQDPSAFAFIASQHEGLLAGLNGRRLTQLTSLDPPRALRLLVRHVDVVLPTTVVPGLQEAMADAADAAGREHWQRLLWQYLAAVHDADPSATQPYHELQVSLTAEYAPGKLMELLSSSTVPLEAALAICEDKGLVAEQVFILGRMGNSLRALHLIIDRLGDIPQAIEFVRGQGDEELWEQLINWALSSPETTGSLLDHIGGYLNPLALIRRIPRGLTIPRLRDRVRSIITDFRTQTSLREGCNKILRSDCARLVTKLHAVAAAAINTVYVAPGACGRPAPPHGTTRAAVGTAQAGGGTGTATGATGEAAAPAPPEQWTRYDILAGETQLAPPQELPPPVVSAGVGMLDLSPVEGFRAAGMVTAVGAAAAWQQPSHVWVGCVPTVSSEDSMAGASTGPSGMAVDVAPSNLSRAGKPGGSAAARRRQQQQQQVAAGRRVAGARGDSPGGGTVLGAAGTVARETLPALFS